MPDIRKLGEISNIVRFLLPITGLTHSTSGLIISTIADVEASATAYTQAASNIETITTLGTFAAPTASKCRFKEVDNTNHPYLYEFQFTNARFAVASAKRLVTTVCNGGLSEPVHYEIVFTPSVNVEQFGGSSGTFNSGVPAVNVQEFGGSSGTFDSGVPSVNLTQIYGNSNAAYTAYRFWSSQHSDLSPGGGTSTTFVFGSSAVFTDDYYNEMTIVIVAGTGAGQVRRISDYVGGTATATVSEAWVTTPSSDSIYIVIGRIE
jgi:hypothetical protein